jgi:hypothetical protein
LNGFIKLYLVCKPFWANIEMRTVSLFLLLFTTISCFSQVYEVKTQEDSLGFAIQIDEGGEDIRIVQADKNGKYKVYNYKNELIIIADIFNKQFNGQFEQYSEGKLEVKGQFSKGRKTGKWFYYNDLDSIHYVLDYKKDTIYGVYYHRDINQETTCVSKTIELYSFTSDPKLISKETKCKTEQNKDHLTLIMKLNAQLSNEWYLEEEDFLAPDSYGNNILFFHVFTPLTEHERGNEGVSLCFLEKKYADHVLKKGKEENCFFETKSYIIYANFMKNWHTDLVKVLCNELGEFFEENKEKL